MHQFQEIFVLINKTEIVRFKEIGETVFLQLWDIIGQFARVLRNRLFFYESDDFFLFLPFFSKFAKWTYFMSERIGLSTTWAHLFLYQHHISPFPRNFHISGEMDRFDQYHLIYFLLQFRRIGPLSTIRRIGLSYNIGRTLTFTKWCFSVHKRYRVSLFAKNYLPYGIDRPNQSVIDLNASIGLNLTASNDFCKIDFC